MSAPVNLVRKAESLVGFQLTSRAEMHTALDWLADNGYGQGNVTFYTANGTVIWQLSFSDVHNATQQTGYVGDWIVITNNASASVYNPALGSALFSVA